MPSNIDSHYFHRLIGWALALSLPLLLLSSFTTLRLPMPVVSTLHSGLEIISITVCFLVFFIAWHGASQTSGTKIIVLSLVALSCGLFDMSHLISFQLHMLPNGQTDSQSWVAFRLISRLLWSLGMVYAVSMPDNGTPYYLPQNNRILLLTWVLLVGGTIANITLNDDVWRFVLNSPIDLAMTKTLSLASAAAGMAALFIVRRTYAEHSCAVPMIHALGFGVLTDITSAFGVFSADFINLPSHLLKIVSFYSLLQGVFWVTVRQPYASMLRMKEDMEHLAVKNAALYKQSEQQHSMMEDTLAKIGSIVSTQLEMKDTLDAIADMAADMMNARQSAIAILHGPTLQVMATYGINNPPQVIPLDSSIASRVVEEKKALFINDLSEHPEVFRPQMIFSDIQSLLSAPLMNEGSIIGVIEAYSNEKDAFNNHKALLLQALGRYAGAAISAAGKYQEVRLRLNEEKHLLKIAQSLASTVDGDTILESCTAETVEALAADIGIGLLSTEVRGRLAVKAVIGSDCSSKEIDLHSCPAFAKIIGIGKPAVLSAEDARPLILEQRDPPVRLLLCLPLTVEKRLLGLLLLGWMQSIPPEHAENLSFPALIAQQIALGLEKVQLYNQIKAMALSDGLTGLANRRNFDMFLKVELQRALSLERPLSLIMIDIDKFKTYNDTYGHLTGDKVLTQLGQIIHANVRTIDLPARYGGEEFSVILPECSSVEAAEIAETLRATVENSHFPDNLSGNTAHVTISLGVATYDPAVTSEEPTVERVITLADQLLYRAKDQGRNQVVSAILL